MKIVDRIAFMKLPAGTMYHEYQPVIFGELMVKGSTQWPTQPHLAGDYTELSLTYANTDAEPNNTDVNMFVIDRERDGRSFAFDYEGWGGNGSYDREQLYCVYEREDVVNLMALMQKNLDEAYPVVVGIPVEALLPLKAPDRG